VCDLAGEPDERRGGESLETRKPNAEDAVGKPSR
jgi:hypothetical protein